MPRAKQDEKVPEELRTQFGAWVRRERLANNLTQVELARRLGISEIQLWRIENGKSGTAYSRIKDIIEALKLPADTVYRVLGVRFPGPWSSLSSEEQREIQLTVRKFTPPDRL